MARVGEKDPYADELNAARDALMEELGVIYNARKHVVMERLDRYIEAKIKFHKTMRFG